jgi:hypothetical protein
MKKSEAELLEEIKKFIESGGSYDEAVAALKAVYGRKDEEDPPPRKN